MRKEDRKRERGFAIRQMEEMAINAPEEFRKMFRLPPDVFAQGIEATMEVFDSMKKLS